MTERIADLRDRLSWRRVPDPKDDSGVRVLSCVRESFCGRYTITWTSPQFLTDPPRPQTFLAWRRGRLNQKGYRETPVLLGGFQSQEKAREACSKHAETHP